MDWIGFDWVLGGVRAYLSGLEGEEGVFFSYQDPLAYQGVGCTYVFKEGRDPRPSFEKKNNP